MLKVFVYLNLWFCRRKLYIFLSNFSEHNVADARPTSSQCYTGLPKQGCSHLQEDGPRKVKVKLKQGRSFTGKTREITVLVLLKKQKDGWILVSMAKLKLFQNICLIQFFLYVTNFELFYKNEELS